MVGTSARPGLPGGLTQRHFDVWATGGFLLSDDNPGLGIFPRELVRETVFSRPDEAVARCRRFFSERNLRADLIHAWREEIAARHTYDIRVADLLDHLARDRGQGAIP